MLGFLMGNLKMANDDGMFNHTLNCPPGVKYTTQCLTVSLLECLGKHCCLRTRTSCRRQAAEEGFLIPLGAAGSVYLLISCFVHQLTESPSTPSTQQSASCWSGNVSTVPAPRSPGRGPALPSKNWKIMLREKERGTQICALWLCRISGLEA